MPAAPLFERIWELQAHITPYDAAYVAQAERPHEPLITGDRTLTSASRAGCTFSLIT